MYTSGYGVNKSIWSILILIFGILSLIAAILVYMLKGNLQPRIEDLGTLILCVLLVVITYGLSPLRKIAEIPAFKEFQLQNPDVDLSSAKALFNGLLTGGITFGVATAADATGFGVFMASASLLGSMGTSYTAIHTSMSVLGVLLNPVVFVPLSVLAGVVAFLATCKTGDSILNEGMKALNKRDYQTAYTAAIKASEKWILKPKQETINSWYSLVRNHLNGRNHELSSLQDLANRLSRNPLSFVIKGGILGLMVGVFVCRILFVLDFGSCWTTFTLIFSVCIYRMERGLSNAMYNIVYDIPRVIAEIKHLEQIRDVKIIPIW